MTIMKEFSELSLWDISHYWHGFSPNQTRASKLPVEVEKTLRVLAAGASRGLYFRCLEHSLYYQAFNEKAWAVRSIAAICQRELKLAYRGVRFKKKFLCSLTMTRTAIALWCKSTNTPAPSFWFDVDDPLLKNRISQLDTIQALSRNGLYQTFPLFVTNENSIQVKQDNENQTSVSLTSLDVLEVPAKEKLIREEISRLARENAFIKHKPLQEIKKRFIRFYHSRKFDSRKDAAREFFDSLSDKERIQLVPTYDSRDPDQSQDKAVRTLTTALREFFSDNPPDWLDDFQP